MKKGFTLIETLVALSLLSMTIVSTLAIITTNLANANEIKNSFIASGLAQEGLEIVRNLRDSDWFAGRPFGAFGGGSQVANGSYSVQWNSQFLGQNSASQLLKNSDGFYGYDAGGMETVFKRSIEISKINDYEFKITADITWNDKRITKQIKVEDHLYDWYESEQ